MHVKVTFLTKPHNIHCKRESNINKYQWDNVFTAMIINVSTI